MKNTPNRVAKMYVNEAFRRLNPKNRPKVVVFKNEYGYHTPLVELNIPFMSFCEHILFQFKVKSILLTYQKIMLLGYQKFIDLLIFIREDHRPKKD